jgi:inorganic pyrophosphatase
MPVKIKPTLYQAHPWHGIESHTASPSMVHAFIEIVPTDTVKYEVDKTSGHLKVDRPQAYSNICPALYGFIPKTYCGDLIAKACMEATGLKDIRGDGDPLDICVLSERVIPHGNLLLEAVPIGGFRMIDKNEADDKIIAVLKNDPAYGKWTDISECPEPLISRLKHYFLTYKRGPDDESRIVSIDQIYGRSTAHTVIQASLKDYADALMS